MVHARLQHGRADAPLLDRFPGKPIRSRTTARTEAAAAALRLREALGLPHGPEAPALVAGDGGPLGADELRPWLRRARLVSLSLETNGGLCRDLLKTRYREEAA